MGEREGESGKLIVRKKVKERGNEKLERDRD